MVNQQDKPDDSGFRYTSHQTQSIRLIQNENGKIEVNSELLLSSVPTFLSVVFVAIHRKKMETYYIFN